MSSARRSGCGARRALDEFDFVSLRGVDEGDAVAIGFEVGAIRERDAVLGEVLAEGFEAVDLEGEVGQVGLDLNGAAVGEVAEFDGFLTFRGFEEDEFGTAGRFMAPDLLESEDFAVKADRPFEVIHAVPGMEQLEGESHGGRVGGEGCGGEAGAGGWKC